MAADADRIFPPKLIASFLDVSESELRKLAREGWIPKAERGSYPLVGCVQGYIRYLRKDARTIEALLFSQAETAALLGISVQAFAKWQVPAREKRGREKLYYWPDVLDMRDKRKYPQGGDSLDSRFQAAREHRARADKLELDLAVQRGELVYVEHISEIWGRKFTAFRARLRAAATKLAPRVNPKDPNRAKKLIEAEHDDALSELADSDSSRELGDRVPAIRRAVGDT